MSGYATVAAQLGAAVSGSDRAPGPTLDRLRAIGIDARAGHDPVNVPAGDDVEVVVSSAIAPDNPEVEAARARGLRVVGRAVLLGELTGLRRTIAVAGAHGKTTTASMVAHVLLGCGRRPGYLIGGELRTTGRGADWGDDPWLVVEADESDRSMLSLHVETAVVTNVELDHHATYGSLGELRAAFATLLASPAHAIVLDRPELLALRGDREVLAYEADGVELEPGGSRMRWRGIDVRLGVPGLHNARNAVAALEAARIAGVAPEAGAAAIASFAGAGRRFERLGTTAGGALVIDDYAHHPTEVAATIAAARTLGPRRLVAAFQPHLYSRTRQLAGAFGRALAGADLACVLDVYPAREHAVDFPGVDGRLVAAAVVDAAPGREVLWLPGFAEAERVLASRLRGDDLLLVLGAGNVRELGERLVVR